MEARWREKPRGFRQQVKGLCPRCENPRRGGARHEEEQRRARELRRCHLEQHAARGVAAERGTEVRARIAAEASDGAGGRLASSVASAHGGEAQPGWAPGPRRGRGGVD